MTLNSQDQQDIVKALNVYRSDSAVNAPPLVWSNDLVADAQKWADYLATTFANYYTTKTPPPDGGPNYPHSTTTYGENIAFASTGSQTPAQQADGWGSLEKPNFKAGIFPDISKTGNWADVGHYSQVIWGDTTTVGCAKASGGGWDILVGRFSPAGNVSGVQVPKPVVLPFKDQDKITLVADNGQYVTFLTSSNPNWNPIEASVIYAQPATNPRSQFTVTILPNNQIALKADNGLFAQRIYYREDYQPIEAHNPSLGSVSQFTVTVLPNNQIALKADNNLFLSRVDRGNQQPIEATKSSIDNMCKFTVAVVTSPA